MLIALITLIQLNWLLLVGVTCGARHRQEFHEHADNGDNNRIEDLVVPHGYRLEEHHVETEDGFILTMYRIPGVIPQPEELRQSYGNRQLPSVDKEGRQLPVLLQHGLLDSCAGFLLLGPGKALGLILADQGKDRGEFQ